MGCGAIVEQGHLPAYREAGLRVVAVHDADIERARAVAREFDVAVVPDSAEGLVEVAGVDIVDIAVPPWVQPGIVALAVSAGRHVLCQKPFSVEMDRARRMVDAAESSGVLLSVNQQMRWTAAMAACRDLDREGRDRPCHRCAAAGVRLRRLDAVAVVGDGPAP